MSAHHAPWRVSGAPLDGFIPVMGAGGVIVALISSLSSTAKQDGNLIAAAPDMLAALVDLNDILGRAESNASGNPEWEAVSKRITAARAAIAKATGAA